MSDNVSITAGSGTDVATDNVGGKHYQRMKLGIGAADSAVMIGHAEDSGHTTADGGIMALAVRNDASAALSGTDLDYTPFAVDSAGRQKIATIETSITPGTSAAHLGKAEDAGHSTGDVGVMAMAVRNDANAALSGTTLDYTPISVDSSGRQKVLLHGRLVNTRLWYHSGALVVAAAADAANVGRIYIENDPDSPVLVAITRVRFSSQMGSALATPTSPRFVLRYFTFTGNTPSGAAITGVEQDSNYGAKDGNWNVRTAATGMTITEGADVASFFTVAGATAVAYSPPSVAEWVSEPDRPLILRPGEGIMLKQADAGTASDTRRVTADFEIEEITQV